MPRKSAPKHLGQATTASEVLHHAQRRLSGSALPPQLGQCSAGVLGSEFIVFRAAQLSQSAFEATIGL